MTNHILDAAAAIKSEISRLQGVLADLHGEGKVSMPTMKTPAAAGESIKAPKKTKAGKRRSRRSSEEVTEQANAMVAFIKSKGKGGATTAEIVKQFGKVLPSIKAFIGTKVDAKLKTIGAGRSTSYVVD